MSNKLTFEGQVNEVNTGCALISVLLVRIKSGIQRNINAIDTMRKSDGFKLLLAVVCSLLNDFSARDAWQVDFIDYL